MEKRLIRKQEAVILLHGLGRTSSSMKRAAEYFESLGYQSINIGYPSTSLRFDKAAKSILLPELKKLSSRRVHFFTHSLGSLVVRALWALPDEAPLDSIGNTVMLSAPNAGSTAANFLSSLPLLNAILGPNLREIKDPPGVLLRSLPFPPRTLAIAGTRSIHPWYSLMLRGKNDGKVTVASALDARAKGHLVLPVSHPFIMKKRAVLEAAGKWLSLSFDEKKTLINF